jgi:hypothetical protein
MSSIVQYPCGCRSDDPAYQFDVGNLVRIKYRVDDTQRVYVGMIVGLACRTVGYTVLLSRNAPDGQILLGSVCEEDMTKVPDHEILQYEGQFPDWRWDAVDPEDVDGSSAPRSASVSALDS